jgi:hypothetical protein
VSPGETDTAVSTWSALESAATTGSPGSVYLSANITAPTGASLTIGYPFIYFNVDLDGCTLNIEHPAAGAAAVYIPGGAFGYSSGLNLGDSSAHQDGVLNAFGGAGDAATPGGGAGIGGGVGEAVGSSYLEGGTVTAIGGAGYGSAGGGAGIGSAGSGPGGEPIDGGQIGIAGGIVTATGGAGGSAKVAGSGAGLGEGGWDPTDSDAGGQTTGITVYPALPNQTAAKVTASSPGGGYAIGPFAPSLNTTILQFNGTLTIPQGSKLSVPTGDYFEDEGTLDLNGTLAGDGIFYNSSVMVLGPKASVADNGFGNGTTALEIQGNIFKLTFNTKGSKSKAPATEYVFAPTLAAAGDKVPAGPSQPPAGFSKFLGWTVGTKTTAALTTTTPLSNYATGTNDQYFLTVTATYKKGVAKAATPTVSLTGLKTGATYAAYLPKVGCKATVTGSTITSCKVTYKVSGAKVTFTATAKDKAGKSGKASLTVGLDSAGLSSDHFAVSVFPTVVGNTYELLVLSATQPVYTGALPGSAKPSSAIAKMKADGTVAGIKRWAIGVKITKTTLKHSLWTLGYRIGGTIHTIQFSVRK